jgi:hypothetical protein
VLTKEDHRSILIIWGIRIFLPIIPTGVSAQISRATREGQPIGIVIEEKENASESFPREE